MNRSARAPDHSLHTIFVVTLPAGNYTLVQQAINGLGYRVSCEALFPVHSSQMLA